MSKSRVVRKTTAKLSTYTKGELIQAASAFGVKPEVVAGALRLVGKDKLTRQEAEEAIKNYLERKVNC